MVEINRNEQLSVTTTASVVSIEKDNENSKRRSIILTNTSTGGEIITISIDKEAVALQGIVLYPGGTWNDSQDGNYLPTQKMITAISSGAGGKLSLQERMGN